MKIKDLKKEHPDIYKRALLNCDQGFNRESNLSSAFNWRITREGSKVWEYVNKGEFDEYYKLYPKTQPKPELSRDELLAEGKNVIPLVLIIFQLIMVIIGSMLYVLTKLLR